MIVESLAIETTAYLYTKMCVPHHDEALILAIHKDNTMAVDSMERYVLAEGSAIARTFVASDGRLDDKISQCLEAVEFWRGHRLLLREEAVALMLCLVRECAHFVSL